MLQTEMCFNDIIYFSYVPLQRKKVSKNATQKSQTTAKKQATQSARKAPNTRKNYVKSPVKTTRKSPAKSVLKSPAKTVLKSPAKTKSPPGKSISPYTSPSKQTILDSFWGRKTELIENNNGEWYSNFSIVMTDFGGGGGCGDS